MISTFRHGRTTSVANSAARAAPPGTRGRSLLLSVAVLCGLATSQASTQQSGIVIFDPSGGKWTRLQEKMRIQEPALARCLVGPSSCGSPAHDAWRAIALEAARRTGTDRLAYVNAAINRTVAYRSDRDNYGAADYWATPAETLRNGGDCEDIAILKFWTLKLAGQDTDSLRLRLVAGDAGAAHMALTARTDATFVLDSLTADIVPVVRYAARPIYDLGIGHAELFGNTTFQIDQANPER